MFSAVLMIIIFLAGLAIGRWLCPSEAVVADRRAAREREAERPEHDHEHARELAELESELSRVRGWTPTGS